MVKALGNKTSHIQIMLYRMAQSVLSCEQLANFLITSSQKQETLIARLSSIQWHDNYNPCITNFETIAHIQEQQYYLKFHISTVFKKDYSITYSLYFEQKLQKFEKNGHISTWTNGVQLNFFFEQVLETCFHQMLNPSWEVHIWYNIKNLEK
jgi:hypothetical protein